MTNINDFASQSNTPDPLVAIDLRIKLATKRLARVKTEYDIEWSRSLDRLLRPTGQADGVGDRLMRRLDELVHAAERRLAALEDERAALLLAALSPDGGAK